MDINIFDSYNLRARICAGFIPLIPFALDVILLMPHLPSIAEGIALAVLFVVSGQIVLSMACRQPKNQPNRNAAAELLAPGSALSDGTRRRYYQKLGRIDPAFLPLSACIDPAASPEELRAIDTQALCADAIVLLRAKSRDRELFHLVHEENINYGFARNMLGLKRFGIALHLPAAVLFGAGIFFGAVPPGWVPPNAACLCLVFHSATVLYYILGVSKANVSAAAKRYAYAILETIDMIDPA